jgi:hypothetical protein
MPLSGFFRITWTVQLLVGLALFGVASLIEYQILRAFFAAPAIAIILTAGLELGKAAAVVWHRYLASSGAASYPASTRAFSIAFRLGLVGFSVLCSLLYLGVHLDRPNLESIRAAELAGIDARLQDDLTRLAADREAHASADQTRRQAEYADARRDHQGQVDALEALLRNEMDNVVGKTFKGPRYQELAERLERARTDRDEALTALSERHLREAAQLAAGIARDFDSRREARIAAAEAERRAAHNASFDGDDRTHDPRVVTLMRMTESVFGLRITPPQFVFVFALFLSLLMELGILIAFDTVTLAVIPALAAQHREAVQSEALMAEVAGNAGRDAIRHREAMDRVRKGAERLVERAWAQSAGQSGTQADPGRRPRAA